MIRPTADIPSLRVLYVNEAFRNFGPGPAVHGWSLVREMRARAITVDIFPPVTLAGSSYAPVAPSLAWSVGRILRSHFTQEPVKLVSGFVRTARRALRVWTRKPSPMPDVILARHTGYDWTPCVLARMLDRPLVLEVNAPIFLEKRLVGIMPPPLLQWMEKVQWRNASRIHAVSHELATILVDAGVSAERIAVIPNGADPLPCVPERETREASIRIVFVGGFYAWHGIDHLLRALAAVESRTRQKLHLSLIGGGPESTRIQQLADTLGVSDIVLPLGRIAHDQVCHELCKADIAIASYPSLQPFYFSPLKIFEYMAAGLPIIASDQGQIAQILRHRETALLYPPGNIGRLAESIIELATQPALRKRLGCAALALLRSRYTWSHTADRIIELCRHEAETHRGTIAAALHSQP